MGGGQPLPRLSFVPGVFVEFPSLPISTFSIGKSLISTKKLFVATSCPFSSCCVVLAQTEQRTPFLRIRPLLSDLLRDLLHSDSLVIVGAGACLLVHVFISSCPAIYVFSGSCMLAFSHHVTVYIFVQYLLYFCYIIVHFWHAVDHCPRCLRMVLNQLGKFDEKCNVILLYIDGTMCIHVSLYNKITVSNTHNNTVCQRISYIL
jgi:hypothetical protein